MKSKKKKAERKKNTGDSDIPGFDADGIEDIRNLLRAVGGLIFFVLLFILVIKRIFTALPYINVIGWIILAMGFALITVLTIWISPKIAKLTGVHEEMVSWIFIIVLMGTIFSVFYFFLRDLIGPFFGQLFR